MNRTIIAVALASATFALAPAAHAAGDAVKGKAVFAQCAACHKADASGKSTIGPNLWKVVGRPAGTLAGFNYSAAMKGAKRSWTPANLDAYLTAPAKAVPGNKMAFAGVKDATARANVIAYLGTLK
ncbi:c-type cytochrome [Novosphingobium piscinae]|uniref:C-type cytochrome n=1 Tax=Novosphingobium piscinae TaxID=1507448 RepID=A0A7X1G0I3_9SPHN|nr:c-type cytochrome [Novosphingobium piscinae]